MSSSTFQSAHTTSTKGTLTPTARPRFSPQDLNRPASDYVSAVPNPAPQAGVGEASSGFEFGVMNGGNHQSNAAKWASLQSGPLTSTAGTGAGGFNWGSSSSSSSSMATTERPSFELGSIPQRPSFERKRGSSNGVLPASMTPHTGTPPPPATSPFFPSSVPDASPHLSSSSPPSTSNTSPAMAFSLPTASKLSFNQSPAFPSARPPNHSNPPRTTSVVNPRFVSLAPEELIELLAPVGASTSARDKNLVLDLRTHTAFVQVHLRHSISICVPSTLLRRPGYGIDRVAEGLNNVDDQTAFAAWQSAESIIVLDADSSVIAESSGLASLLSKFDKAGAKGRLAWVKGGWVGLQTALQSRPDQARTLIESGNSDGVSPDGSSSSGSTMSGSTTIGKKHARPVLQVRDLPASAFQQSSTSAFAHSGMPTSAINLGGRPTGETSRSEVKMNGLKRRKSGATGFDMSLNSRDNAEGSLGHPPQYTGEKRVAANPFFDNIRQNSEALSLERSLANLSPVELAKPPSALLALLPPYLVRLLELEPMKRAEILARQFYDLEIAERERLEGTLNWHATVQGRENDGNKAAQRFQKYGISAGVELGALNRFKNIFPYDHSRVRLKRHDRGATDYVNASHVHLQGLGKRFIASQGPLPATFHDFWQLCDQEKVGVIVMLTNLHEGGREKCGRYWVDEPTSEWKIETTGSEDADAQAQAQQHAAQERAQGGFFAPAPVATEEKQESAETTLRRTIMIRRRSESPSRPSRKIRHIQYRAWPDFDIPAAPEDVVELVREVDQAQKEYLEEIGWTGDVEPPVVTHCSAGCGRTGVFILVSTILEQMRNERARAREKHGTSQLQDALERADKMDIDTLSSSPVTTKPEERATPINSGFPPTPSTLIPQTASLSIGPTSQSPYGDSPRLLSPDASQPSSAFNLSGHEVDPTSSSSSPLPTTLPHSSKPTPTSQDENALERVVPSLQHVDPIFAGVNEMRQQRMSMIANPKQFIAVHEAVLCGALMDIKDELHALQVEH